ncbi:ParB/RepB/Spo0J family partition protein [Bartonella sp. DGB2]|uniref:ParB/RepB/Spo0J family partition protein n=1 Tax=Bartonella sp. DGB2 TaxID=3388426 RepID=UPI00398FF8AC
MSEEQAKKRLGRGLAALIGDIDSILETPVRPLATPNATLAISKSESEGTAVQIRVAQIRRNPHNPRRHFKEDALEELAQSIRQYGVVQPVIVRPAKDDPHFYELIAGERRWQAARRASLTEIPALIRTVDDRTALELALIENIQRSDLNPIEEAQGYQALIDGHDYSQNDLAQLLGKSRSHLANSLRLLKLPAFVQQLLVEEKISTGHARCLINASNPQALADRILREGLSVRQTEALLQEPLAKVGRVLTTPQKDNETQSLEKLLADVIGMKVVIKHGKKGGDVKIHYNSLDELDDICRRLQN